MRRLCLVTPLAISLACTFDGTGQDSAGAPDSDSGTAGSSSSTGTSTGTSTSTDPTTDPTTGSSTTAVDPTTSSTTSTTTPPPTCGDGVLDPGEDCDTGELAGKTCVDFGMLDGVLACAGDCTFDLSGCLPNPLCGNGVLDPDEVCDGDLFDGQTCETEGFDKGDLACQGCALDTSGCSNDPPPDWFDAKYPKRRKLTIPKAHVTGKLTDFPVAIVITDPAVIDSLVPVDKLVFTALDKTVLSHELALAEPDRVIVWVELPSLTEDADNEFWVYYGSDEGGATEDPAGTWSNEFLAVWHLDEQAVDEEKTAIHVDATGSGHDGTQNGNYLKAACRVGPCQLFGHNDWIEVANDADFALGNAHATIAAWVRPSNDDVYMAARAIFARSNPANQENDHLLFGHGPEGDLYLGFEQKNAGHLKSQAKLAYGTLTHVAWTQKKDDGGAAKDLWTVYINGVAQGTLVVDAKAAKMAHIVRIGGPTMNSEYPDNFRGDIDELHVSTTFRNADWIKTTYDNQLDPVAFTTIGPEEAY